MVLGAIARGVVGRAGRGSKMAGRVFKREVPASEQTVDVKATPVVQPKTPLIPPSPAIDANTISKATPSLGTETLEGTAYRIKTSLVDVDTLSIQNLIIIDENPEKRETIIYKNGVIEENLIIPKTKSYYDDIIDVISERENISIKRLSNQREEKVFSNRRIEDNLSPEEFLLKVGKISKSKEVLFETAYNDLSKRNPIEDRIGDLNKFEEVLEGNFNKMDIELDFEYAIFKEENLTKIASKGFEIESNEGMWKVRTDVGHSPEHISLTDKKRSLYLAGDFLLPRISPNVSDNFFDPFDDRLGGYLNYLNDIKTINSEVEVFPCHDWPFKDGDSRAVELINHHNQRLDTVSYTHLTLPTKRIV